MESEQVVSVGTTVNPFTHQVVALNLELVANQLKELNAKLPKSPLPNYALEFDLNKMLACIAKFLATCDDSVDNWHKIFVDEDFRKKVKWERLEELYWSNNEPLEKSRLIQYTLNVYESYFVKQFQPVFAAYFIKLAEAKGINEGEIPVELKAEGNPWIEGNFLIWGQPLSLCDELYQFYPQAICGANQTEPFSQFISRNCAKYKIKITLPFNSAEIGKTRASTASSLRKHLFDLMALRERRNFLIIALETNRAFLEEHLRMLTDCYYAFLKKEVAEETMRNFLGGTLIEQNEKVVKIFQAIQQFAEDGSDSKLADTARDVIGRPAGTNVVVDSNSVSNERSVHGNFIAEPRDGPAKNDGPTNNNGSASNGEPANNDGPAVLPKKRKLSSSPRVARKMSNVKPTSVVEKISEESGSHSSLTQFQHTGNTSDLAASKTSLGTETKTTDFQLGQKGSKDNTSVSKGIKRSSGTKKTSSTRKTLDNKAKEQTSKSRKVKKRKSSSSSSSTSSSSGSSSSGSSSSSESSSSSSDSNEKIIDLQDDQSSKSIKKEIQSKVL